MSGPLLPKGQGLTRHQGGSPGAFPEQVETVALSAEVAEAGKSSQT